MTRATKLVTSATWLWTNDRAGNKFDRGYATAGRSRSGDPTSNDDDDYDVVVATVPPGCSKNKATNNEEPFDSTETRSPFLPTDAGLDLG